METKKKQLTPEQIEKIREAVQLAEQVALEWREATRITFEQMHTPLTQPL